MRCFNVNNTHLFGRVLNLSMMAIQLLIMAVITSVIGSFLIITLGAIEADLFGPDRAFNRMGLQYEQIVKPSELEAFEEFSQLSGQDPKKLAAQLASSSIIKNGTHVYHISVLLLTIFLTFSSFMKKVTNKFT